MGRIGTAFKTDLLTKANGKASLIDDYIVIPKGKIDCVSCSQSFPVTDLVVKRLECPQCHTTSKLLIDGKEIEQLRNPQRKVTEIPMGDKLMLDKEMTFEKEKPFLMHEKNPVKVLGENFWYENKDELLKSPDREIWERNKKKTIEEYPEGIKFVPNEHIIKMYQHIITGDEKVSESEAKVIHSEMNKRKLWERVKGKPENFDVTGEKQKEKVIIETKKELSKPDNLLDNIRKRLREDEKKDFDNLPEEKKELANEIQQKVDTQLEKDKQLIDSGKADEKTKKRFFVMERLRKKYGDDIEGRVGYIIVRIENRALMLFTGHEEKLAEDEKDDLAFCWELMLVKYGIDNVIMMLPEIMLIGMHVEIFGGHVYENHRKKKERKERLSKEKEDNQTRKKK